MAKIKLEDCKIGMTDQFFFDTNVWILLFSPIANYQLNDQKRYSAFFKELLRKDSPIFITSMIISEFANVQLRLDFNQWKSKSGITHPDYKKDFIGTNEYKKSVASVVLQIKKILRLPIVFKVSDNFNGIDFDNIITNFEYVDFNDSYIAELAQRNNYKIVTNDADMLKIFNGPNIITSRI